MNKYEIAARLVALENEIHLLGELLNNQESERVDLCRTRIDKVLVPSVEPLFSQIDYATLKRSSNVDTNAQKYAIEKIIRRLGALKEDGRNNNDDALEGIRARLSKLEKDKPTPQRGSGVGSRSIPRRPRI